MPKMNQTLIGIVLLAVGFAFLSGALLQTAPTAKSVRVWDTWSDWRIDYPGNYGNLPTQWGFKPTPTSEPTGFHLSMSASVTGNYHLHYRITCQGPYSADPLYLVSDSDFWIYLYNYIYVGVPVWATFTGDNPDYVQGHACTFVLRGESDSPGDYPGQPFVRKSNAFVPHSIFWGEPLTGAPPATQPPLTSPTVPPDLEGGGGANGAEPCDPGFVRDDAGACAAKPAELGVWLILGLLILLIIVGAAVVLLGVFG